MEFKHISVLFGESIDALNIKPNGIYADGTLGGGGHSHGILSTNDSCRLIGIDQDKEAIAAAKERLKEFDGRVTFVNRNFSEIKDILSELDIDEIDGAVLDLGVSSYQLDNAERGFSYMHDAALDMRMNTSSPKSAYDVVSYKLYDSNGYLIDSSNIYLSSLGTGDKFKEDSIVVYDIVPGETYSIQFSEYNW